VKRAVEELGRLIDQPGVPPRRETAVEGLTLLRQTEPRPGVATMYRPSLCVAAGGRKEVVLGESVFELDPGDFLVVTVEVPVTGCIVRASPAAPYIGLILDLDPLLIADLVLDLPPAPPGPVTAAAVAAGTLDEPLLDPLTRLVRLVHDRAAAPVLAPLAKREIHYRLLAGEHGSRLRQIAGDGHLAQIAIATSWIRDHYAEPMSVGELARESAMSPTSFHRHFKAATMLTPMQYRTQIRLQEARRLMLSGELDATSIGLAIGYESHSQFSREYRRMFGVPPGADATRLRANLAETAA
jgi:AraC-like DNA-binding protein